MNATESELSTCLAATNFFSQLGFRLVRAGEGECVLHAPFLASSLRPGEMMAGYVLAAAADVAAWLAIKTLLGIDDGSLTLDMHSVYLAPARSEIECAATVTQAGRRLVHAACADAARRAVSGHTLIYARRA
ncbi:MAG: PaaI family thioesterase [Vulcanimicrobiaceae bacterium]